MITLAVSFLLFFVVLGFQWFVGVHLLAQLFEALPITQGAWADTSQGVQNNIKTIMLWAPSIMLLFASVKMIMNAASRGED